MRRPLVNVVRRVLSVMVLAASTILVTTAPAAADEPEGTAFGSPCAAVYVINVSGSYESTGLGVMTDGEKSIFRSLSQDITQNSPDGTVKVHTIDYPARIVGMLDLVPKIMPALGVVPDLGAAYRDSKNQGYDATWSTMHYYGQQCRAARFVLVGYSQGAHIMGDIAATIATNGTPVTGNRILGVHLLADPARAGSYRPLVGDGSGADGLAVLGRVSGRGFGDLSDRVVEYCMKDDGVCDASASGLTNLAESRLQGGNHTLYGSATVPGTSETYLNRLRANVFSDATVLTNNPQF